MTLSVYVGGALVLWRRLAVELPAHRSIATTTTATVILSTAAVVRLAAAVVIWLAAAVVKRLATASVKMTAWTIVSSLWSVRVWRPANVTAAAR